MILTTAWRDPTAASSEPGLNMPANVHWINPTNAEVQDNIDATQTVSIPSVAGDYDILKCTTYGFNIPNGSIIKGIEVQARAKKVITAGSPTIFFLLLELYKAGTIGGSNLAANTAVTTSYVFYSFGGPTNLWGRTWTSDDINNSGFGNGITAGISGGIKGQSGTLNIDVVEMRVTYIPPSLLSVMGCGI